MFIVSMRSTSGVYACFSSTKNANFLLASMVVVLAATLTTFVQSANVVVASSSSNRLPQWTLSDFSGECKLNISSKHAGRCQCNQILDIRCPEIDQIPQFAADDRVYSAIYLANQNITRVPEAAFGGLKVRKIVLNFNDIRDRLNGRAWVGLEKVLTELHLAECRLTSLPDGMLNEMTELRHLHLWNNEITHISANFFKGCQNLRELSLWGNRIERIEQNTFNGLWSLRRLDLDRNRISVLTKEAFKHLKHLEVIHLGQNRIREISSDTFNFTRNLKVLSLDGNGLNHIYNRAFQGLNGLLSLALQNNNISYLPSDGLFANMSRLTTLLLQNNRLETVWPKTFIGLKNLSRLDLADNRLTQLPEGVLHKSTKLRHVYLDNNNLKTLGRCTLMSRRSSGSNVAASAGMTHYQPQHLRTVSLLGNSGLMCDCRLTWLVDISERDGVSVWGTCAKSRHLQGPTSVVNRLPYRALSCSFTTQDCKQ